jgi:predicted nucleic acid-binding protein
VVQWKEVEQSTSLYENKVRDTKDAPVLAAVVVAKPDFAVTGDLGLREDMKRCSEATRATRICSSRQFLKNMLKKRR